MVQLDTTEVTQRAHTTIASKTAFKFSVGRIAFQPRTCLRYSWGSEGCASSHSDSL